MRTVPRTARRLPGASRQHPRRRRTCNALLLPGAAKVIWHCVLASRILLPRRRHRLHERGPHKHGEPTPIERRPQSNGRLRHAWSCLGKQRCSLATSSEADGLACWANLRASEKARCAHSRSNAFAAIQPNKKRQLAVRVQHGQGRSTAVPSYSRIARKLGRQLQRLLCGSGRPLLLVGNRSPAPFSPASRCRV